MIIKQIPPSLIDGKTYFADEDGNIINQKGRKLKVQFSKRDATNPRSHGGNYPHVKIDKERAIHLLVCAAFWGVSLPDQVCHHLDGNKFNNRPSNLIWVARADHPRFDSLVRQGIILQHFNPEKID